MPSFVFRAVAGVVNGAACAVNHLLEVMYPTRYDAAHIWDDDDVPACSVASGGPAPTGPTPGGVADPAGDTPPSPAGSLTSPAAGGEGDDHSPEVDDALAGNRDTKATAAGGLTWQGWAEPAVLDVLSAHQPVRFFGLGRDIGCHNFHDTDTLHDIFGTYEEWCEHVAPILVARIGCDPARAIAALQQAVR